jgi:hypothetical protein
MRKRRAHFATEFQKNLKCRPSHALLDADRFASECRHEEIRK